MNSIPCDSPCEPPCVRHPMMGMSWWKQFGYGSPCGCAYKAKEDYEKQMKQIADLRTLKWNDKDRATLSKKYLKLMVHIALEKADEEHDLNSFCLILTNDLPNLKRTDVLKYHLALTCTTFDYNYYNDSDVDGTLESGFVINDNQRLMFKADK